MNTWPIQKILGSGNTVDLGELVKTYFSAAQEGKITAKFYSEDAVLHYSGRHKLSGDYEGFSAMERMFKNSSKFFPGGPILLEPKEILTGGPYVNALVDAAASDHQGEPIRWLRIVVFRFEGDRIAEQWLFDFDPQRIEEILR